MLVIRRRAGQSILIGDDIKIEIVEAAPGRVKVGIIAPREVLVLREEVALTRDQNRLAALRVPPAAVQSLVRAMRQEPAARQESGGG